MFVDNDQNGLYIGSKLRAKKERGIERLFGDLGCDGIYSIQNVLPLIVGSGLTRRRVNYYLIYL